MLTKAEPLAAGQVRRPDRYSVATGDILLNLLLQEYPAWTVYGIVARRDEDTEIIRRAVEAAAAALPRLLPRAGPVEVFRLGPERSGEARSTTSSPASRSARLAVALPHDRDTCRLIADAIPAARAWPTGLAVAVIVRHDLSLSPEGMGLLGRCVTHIL